MLEHGRIIWAEVLDQRNRNLKERPLVIIDATSAIVPGQPINVVCGTTQFDRPLPKNSIELPYARGGHCPTRLRRMTVVVCDWLREVEQDEILEVGGIVPRYLMKRIVSQIIAGGNS